MSSYINGESWVKCHLSRGLSLISSLSSGARAASVRGSVTPWNVFLLLSRWFGINGVETSHTHQGHRGLCSSLGLGGMLRIISAMGGDTFPRSRLSSLAGNTSRDEPSTNSLGSLCQPGRGCALAPPGVAGNAGNVIPLGHGSRWGWSGRGRIPSPNPQPSPPAVASGTAPGSACGEQPELMGNCESNKLSVTEKKPSLDWICFPGMTRSQVSY